MWGKSHQRRDTWIGHIREAVEHWRSANNWSRETACQLIVEAHERINGVFVTGIEFDPPSRDTFTRIKANTERIYRWLDDDSKDNNLLPTNFIPSILSALPLDYRLKLSNELLLPSLLRVEHLPEVGGELSARDGIKQLIKDASEAEIAMVALLDGIDSGELESLQSRLLQLHSDVEEMLNKVGGMLVKQVDA